ncbi:MAG: type II secretion system protein GspL, partial [Wenzhouxiangellaceae bacterium]
RSKYVRLIDLADDRDACFCIDEQGRVDAAPAADAAGCESIALVPADRVSLITVELPRMSPARLEQALRWAVEDRIAGDPAGQHVVPLRRLSGQQLQCMVVARVDMQQWLDRLDHRPTRMLPDAACLPWQPGQVVLAPSAEAVLARWGETEFDRISPDLLDDLLPELSSAPGSAGQARPGETVWLGPGPVPDGIAGLVTRVDEHEGDGLEAMAAVAAGDSAADLDLLRGEFALADAAGDRRRLRWLAGLAAAVLALWVGHALVDYMLLERQHRQQADQLEQRVTELFPEIGVLVRPRAQVERALAELRGVHQDRFVQLVAGANSLIAGAEGLRLNSLSYADGVLELRLQAPSLADFEALQRRARTLDLRAELGDVSVRPEATDARMIISGVAP